MKTSDLIGHALSLAVAKCEGRDDVVLNLNGTLYSDVRMAFDYPTDWELGGPIIEREFIELRPGSYTGKDRLWAAWSQNRRGDRSIGNTGPTPLIAAMRCYVASKLGDEVEIPEELK